ncbi:ferredoxin [Nitrososphaera viennensis]|uniref:ferredoxin n=1 Tax=Nitrososphaera viennensis TaxID=1034015 RepID=UPI00130E898F|nr:DnaJ domain-containing protein [Nitrososphaera viennensis]
MADSKGYYAILGVSERASQLEIKKAYRRLARKYHPDRNGAVHAEDMIKKINAAYEVLSDIHKREQYDRSSFGDVSGQEQEAHVHEEPRHAGGGGQAEEHAGGDAAAEYAEQQPRAKKAEAKKDTADHYYGPTHIETPKSRFHIIVEPSLCMAFGSCETLAPKVFVVEKNKRVNPKARVESETGADYETIHAAAQTCPTKAIRIIDRYTGEQLFP